MWYISFTLFAWYIARRLYRFSAEEDAVNRCGEEPYAPAPTTICGWKEILSYPATAATSAVQNPNSQFGTRELAFHKITGATSGSTTNFAAIILALQTVAEVYYVNAVAATTLAVAVAANTNNGAGVGNTANDVTMKEAIDNAVYAGVSTVTVGAADTAVFQAS